MEFLVLWYGGNDPASPYIGGFKTRNEALDYFDFLKQTAARGEVVEARRIHSDGVTTIMERFQR